MSNNKNYWTWQGCNKAKIWKQHCLSWYFYFSSVIFLLILGLHVNLPLPFVLFPPLSVHLLSAPWVLQLTDHWEMPAVRLTDMVSPLSSHVGRWQSASAHTARERENISVCIVEKVTLVEIKLLRGKVITDVDEHYSIIEEHRPETQQETNLKKGKTGYTPQQLKSRPRCRDQNVWEFILGYLGNLFSISVILIIWKFKIIYNEVSSQSFFPQDGPTGEHPLAPWLTPPAHTWLQHKDKNNGFVYKVSKQFQNVNNGCAHGLFSNSAQVQLFICWLRPWLCLKAHASPTPYSLCREKSWVPYLVYSLISWNLSWSSRFPSFS